LLALAVALHSSTARAADPAELVRSRLAEAEKRYADQEYRAAIEACHAVLSDQVATRDQRARAYEYLGLSWLILGKRARAREAFEDLLAIDPQYTLSDPSRSPKLRQFFDEVRASFVPGYQRGSGEAELEHAAPSGAVAGRPIEVAALVTRGAPLVAEVTLHARRQGLLQFTVETLRAEGGRYTLSFAPPRETADYLLEYYLEARDAKGRVIARVASPERPIALPVRGVPAPAATPWFKRWYVWAAVGGVVAAAAIGATVAATAQRAPSGTLPPGQVSLGLRF